MCPKTAILQAAVLLAILQPSFSTPVSDLHATGAVPTGGRNGSKDVTYNLIHESGEVKGSAIDQAAGTNREIDKISNQKRDGVVGSNDSLPNKVAEYSNDLPHASVHALEAPPFEPELRRRLRSHSEEEESAGADESYEYSTEAFQASEESASETTSDYNNPNNVYGAAIENSSDNTGNAAGDTGDTVDGASDNAVSASSRMIRPMVGNEPAPTSSNRHAETNLEHVAKMVLKIIKTYKIRSMVDIPCRNSLEFMPALLHRIDFEVPGFKYYCVDSERDSHDDIAHLFGDAANPDIIHIRPEAASTMPKSDLVLSWDGPQDWGVTRFWSFLMHIRQIRPNYILITNNPGEVNGDKPNVLNLRKQPFHVSICHVLTRAKRSYSNE